MSAVRPVSTSQQTGDGVVKPHQPSDEASQRGTEAQCHVGNDASEHTAETGFSPVLLAGVVHHVLKLSPVQSSLLRKNFIYQCYTWTFNDSVYFMILCIFVIFYYYFCILTSIF